MTRPCATPGCHGRAKKLDCACPGGVRVCDECRDTHRCAALENVDPKRWRAEHAPEEAQTTEIVDALNAMPEMEMAWQSRKRGGVRANDAARAVADITGIAKDGTHVEVELKGSHKDDCACDSCAAQRDRAERVRGAKGVYVARVRKKQEAVDGVRMGLARARERSVA